MCPLVYESVVVISVSSFILKYSWSGREEADNCRDESDNEERLREAKYVYVCGGQTATAVGGSTTAFEGPFRVLQRSGCQFKIDLGDHEAWIATERLKVADLINTAPHDHRPGSKAEESTSSGRAALTPPPSPRLFRRQASEVLQRSFRRRRMSSLTLSFRSGLRRWMRSSVSPTSQDEKNTYHTTHFNPSNHPN